jgi:hypothetical protein
VIAPSYSTPEPAKAGWKIAEPVAWQLVGDEAVLVDLGAGRAIGLNDTGSFIWPLIERECEAGIVRAVVRRFRVDAEVARTEVARFVDLLSARGLIVARETSPAAPGPAPSDAGVPEGGAA